MKKKTVPLHFHKSNGPVDDAIDDLIRMAATVHHPRYIREMIIAALKAGQEHMDRADLKLMNTTMKEMRFTGKVFGPYRHIRKVTVFGSARVGRDDPAYRTATDLGRKLKEAGYMVITGGGPGIMQAVNEGAGPEYSFGVNIRLPFEQKNNPVVDGNRKNLTYKYFFNRKVAFLKEAHAVVLFPGGFGTLDEAMETLTLVQTGKHDIIPLILMDPPGSTYWSRWLDFFQSELIERGFVNPSDAGLFRRVESVGGVMDHITRFYKSYHSMRYSGDRLILRFRYALPEACIAELNRKYSEILLPGGEIRASAPLPEEANEPKISHLPRLVVDFNRNHFGRLRELIDDINQFIS